MEAFKFSHRKAVDFKDPRAEWEDGFYCKVPQTSLYTLDPIIDYALFGGIGPIIVFLNPLDPNS
jgi:hypothetical protein